MNETAECSTVTHLAGTTCSDVNEPEVCNNSRLDFHAMVLAVPIAAMDWA